MPATASPRPVLAWAGLFGRVFALAALAVGVLGVLRLLRQFPAAASSPSLLVPFMLPVLAFAIEAGALVALSATVAEVCRRQPRLPLLERGGPIGAVWALCVVAFVAAGALPRGSERPGALANELITQARQSCGGSESVPVPLLGLTVRCDHGARLEGPMPGAPRVQLSMQSLTFSDDLRRVAIQDLDLTARRWLSVRLRAREANIVGLSPWARSARLTTRMRGAIGGLLALCIALLFFTLVPTPEPASTATRPSRGRIVLRLALGGIPGLVTALVLIALDQEQAEPRAYAWAFVAAIGGAGAVAFGRWLAPKFFSSFSTF